jgi:hypothetical protein
VVLYFPFNFRPFTHYAFKAVLCGRRGFYVLLPVVHFILIFPVLFFPVLFFLSVFPIFIYIFSFRIHLATSNGEVQWKRYFEPQVFGFSCSACPFVKYPISMLLLSTSSGLNYRLSLFSFLLELPFFLSIYHIPFLFFLYELSLLNSGSFFRLFLRLVGYILILILTSFSTGAKPNTPDPTRGAPLTGRRRASTKVSERQG